MTLHRLQESLDYSHSVADKPWWPIVYARAFPDMVAMHDLRHNGWHQQAGRDRAVVLNTGRAIWIDEKVRGDAWHDIAVEVWSVYPWNGRAPYPEKVPNAVPGWAVAVKDCDYIAYAFEPTATCHIFPYLGLRAAWEKHGGHWRGCANKSKNGYRWIRAENERGNGTRYLSISIAVPIEDLHNAIADALTIRWA